MNIENADFHVDYSQEVNKPEENLNNISQDLPQMVN